MAKSILLVDSSKNSTTFLEVLFKDYSSYEVDVMDDYSSIISAYTNDRYEYVIFDHSCKISNQMMEYILTNNPSQKSILLSDSLNCPVTCNMCLESFNFVRLLKPIDVKSVLHYIDTKNQFICPNKNVFDNINSLKKLHEFLNLDDNSYYTKKELLGDKMVISSLFDAGLRINEMDKIEDNINKKYFTLNVMSNNNLEIKEREEF